MMLRMVCGTTLGLFLTASTAVGQAPTQPWRPASPTVHPGAGQVGPVIPQYAPAPQYQPTPPPVRAPFQLTPQEEDYLNRVLLFWEQRGQQVKTFACNFCRWDYDGVFGNANAPRYVDKGLVKYAAPDKGLYRVTQSNQNQEWVAIESQREEHWVCDGKSVYEFNHKTKQLIQHVLPPELQGTAIQDGPLPFLFGAQASKLKERYFMRVITPPNIQNQIWLEAYPRFQRDAANFQRAELILSVTETDLNPFALQLFSPNGKDRTVFQFGDIVVNNPWPNLDFVVITPPFWTKVVIQPETPRVGQQPAAGGPR
ncbi:MAG TPA: TIGR03009 domain-containing protein [Thermoguttaceae bacterium]|nr:TIGR03009 domain-containing protein [Thermoguttaceae bacterium]